MNELSLIEIEEKLLDYLRKHRGAETMIEVDTDVIESGLLDSMLVMDLVLFAEAQFSVKLEPCDITPHNLRNIQCLAQCIRGAGKRGQNRLATRSAGGVPRSPLSKMLVGHLFSGLQGFRP